MMKTKYINIDDYWGVLFIYDYESGDIDEMMAIMDSFGMERDMIERAIDVLSDVNTGMTISQPSLRMSALFISRATSINQFADTIAHEIDHVQDAICDYYGVPFGSEDAAWLQGYIARGVMYHLSNDCLEESF